MPTLLTTTLSLYLAWAAALSDSLFHRVWSVALFLFSLLTTAIFNSRVSVSTVPLAVLDLLIFALCIALSPAQLLLHPAKSVDQKDKALDTLFPKSDEDKRESLFTDIVAVHGLASKPKTAWESRYKSQSGDKAALTNKPVWLQDFLPEEELHARIMAFNHNTSWEAYALSKLLHDLGDDLLQELRNARQTVEEQTRPIIFVGHSFGGLIIKQALVNASADSADDFCRNIRERACGFIFLGTPHKGAHLTIQGRLKSLFGFWKGSSTNLLEIIGPGSDLNQELHNSFMKYLQTGPGTGNTVCVFEAVKESIWGMPITHVVEKESAVIDGSHKIGVEKSHRNIQRFDSRSDENYQNILFWIQRWANKAKENALTAQTARAWEKTQIQQECLRSLAFPEMDRRKNDIDDETPNTCNWLLKNEKYTTWLARSQALLWIEGKPGAGKSTLLRYAVRQPRQSNDIVASFFFSARGAPIQQTSLGMFRSLLHQLLEKNPEMLSKFSLMYEKKRDTQLGPGQNLEWHERELREFLDSYTTILPEAHPIRIYVDALDESGQDVAIGLVNYFRKLTSRPSLTRAGISVCFSCRHYPVLAPSHELEKICVEKKNYQDIRTHVRTSLRDKFPDEGDALELERNIVEKASGVFQWVILVIRIILKLNEDGANLKRIRQKIEELPDKLEDLYKDVLSKIEDRARAVQLMQWVCFAQWPLSLKELRFAMVIDATTSYTSFKQCQSSSDFSETDEQMRRTVTSLSGGLAETRDYQDSQTVQFIHQSVTDYMVRSGLPNLDSSLSDSVIGRSHLRLLRSCVKFLTLEEVLRYGTEKLYGFSSFEEQERKIENLFPLLNYSVTNWTAHAEVVEAQRIPQDDLLELFRWPSDDIINSWRRYNNSIGTWSGLIDEITLLHIASSHGLPSIIEAMIRSGEAFDINSKDRRGRTPLSWAAQSGKEVIVQLLIKQGAEVDSKDILGRTPLFWAAERGHEAEVQLLIEQGAEVDSKDNEGRTPLSWAAEGGHEAEVQLLIEQGAEVDSKDNDGRTPLSLAISWGQEAVVQLLIEKGAEVDSKDNKGRTPLSWAAQSGEEVIVQFLIKQGAEADSKDNTGRTPLSLAAVWGRTAIVRFLIERDDVDINSRDRSGRTPLAWALEGYMPECKSVVKLLKQAITASSTK